MLQALGDSAHPALCAIVVIPDTYQTVAQTVDALVQQTAASQIELLFVIPQGAEVSIPSNLAAAFSTVRVVEIPNFMLTPALAEGVRCATAPIVAFTEDHAFPAPNWADALIQAHSRPFAAVGPAMRNANPSTLVSRADFYMGYGKWAAPIEAQTVDFLMEHNSSYKRGVLLEYGPRLDEMLESETVMQFDLARRGHTFWLEGSTSTKHLCFGQRRPWLACMLWHGRVFAARRSQQWSAARRALYAISAPLVPLVRLSRIRRDVNRVKLRMPERLQLLGAIFIGLVAEAAGQGLGYALRAGDAAESSLEHEFHRDRFSSAISSAPAE